MKNLVATQKWLMFLLITLLLISVVQSVSYGGGKIYWTDVEWVLKSGKIRRTNLDGSNLQDVVTGLQQPVAVTLDMLRRKVYWTDAGTRKIQRANLNGRQIETLATGFKLPRGGGEIHIECRNDRCKGQAFPRGGGVIELDHDRLIDPRCMAVDVGAGKIYWANWFLDEIQRANLNGSDRETVVRLVSASRLALDVRAGKIYWTEYWSDKIRRANLDGSNVETLVTGLKDPDGIALDVEARKMYWTDGDTGKIQRANLDGSNVEVLVTKLDTPSSLALDVGAGKMYWGAWDKDSRRGKIQRANLNGTNVRDIRKGLGYPWDIALVLPGAYSVTPRSDKLTTSWAKVKVQ